MKKIIAAFDGLHYSESTKDYTVELAKKTETHPVGVFLEDPGQIDYSIYNRILKENITGHEEKDFRNAHKTIRRAAVESFEKSCEQAGLNYSIHHDKNIPLEELTHESVYADLLIIDAKENFGEDDEKTPTHFICNLLANVHCPVLLVPKQFKPFHKITFLFDGKPSSVHAIKMFSYLLPRYKYLDTEIISVKPENASFHLQDNKLIRELVKRHFPNVTYTVLHGTAKNEIINYLKRKKENALIVLGAYQRSSISRHFHESMANTLAKETELPLFIAHNK